MLMGRGVQLFVLSCSSARHEPVLRRAAALRVRSCQILTADSLCVVVVLVGRHARRSRCGWWTGAK